MKTCPCVFIGIQQAPDGMAPFALFNLLADIPGHRAKSTVSAMTLLKLGYEPPVEELAKINELDA